ncbi:phosphopantothenoylcysteine decarboxylase [Anaplasma phagocytophilum]|uniref:phosphopantothenoylcysteine decarboxylase n=1 Tax=Anaplasma phagocytophilum TaxID=948 RepID=UPI00200BEF6E|nr:phosphopantothenoylcysteine decarboxylase [Anaplasma phagocytophilum]UQD54323.1 phosphopantothenoylcysteine decarboxylase [Anaplasma phagocytophilum]
MDILLIITGSVAAYKALEVIRELRRRKYNLRCVLSKAGEQFITPLSVSALSDANTYTESDSFSPQECMKHISLSRGTDLILVVPASADIMGKAAHGICDDLPTTILMAANVPVIMAPAMNTAMWQSPAMQRNLNTLKQDKVFIIEPETGILACGEEGPGKMAKVEDIVAFVEKFQKC